MTKEMKQQFTLRISQANETQMVVILYEMMLCYLDEARKAGKKENRPEFLEGIRKSRACLLELMSSLDYKYAPALQLRELYWYCLRMLARAEGKGLVDFLDDVERVIAPLHDAYLQIAPQNTKGPVMNNSQTVYAGLTYGRNTLTENMTDQGANRGMRV